MEGKNFAAHGHLPSPPIPLVGERQEGIKGRATSLNYFQPHTLLTVNHKYHILSDNDEKYKEETNTHFRFHGLYNFEHRVHTKNGWHKVQEVIII